MKITRSKRGLFTIASGFIVLLATGGVGQTLHLSLPVSAGEFSGTLTNAGAIGLGGVFSTNVTVNLTASPTGQVTIPSMVVVPAGRSSTTFDLVLVDNYIPDGNRTVTISAGSPGWNGAQTTLSILDDDPATLQLTTIQSPQFAGVAFTSQLLALDINGQQLKSGTFTAQISIESTGLTNLLGTASVTNGQCNLAITSAVPVLSGQLAAEGHGLRVVSNPFNILQSLNWKLPSAVRDAAWNGANKTLYASIPDGSGTNGGMIVTVDTTSGAMTGWAMVPMGISSGPYGGRLNLSPDGQALFVSAGYGNQLQRWDVAARTFTTNFDLPVGQFVVDMAVAWANPWRLVIVPGQTNTSVTAMMLNEYLIPQSTPASHFLRSVVADPILPETFYHFRPYQVAEWKTGDAGVSSERTLRNGPFLDAVLPMTVAQGRLFMADGYVEDLTSATFLGRMGVPTNLVSAPKTGLVATDSSRHQVIVAGPVGTGVTRLQSFDSSDLLIRRDVLLPLSINNPQRMLFCGSNILVIVANNTLGMVRWPVGPPGVVDIAVNACSLSTNPVIGADWNWSVEVTNRGPGDATDVRLQLPLPAGATVVRSATTSGRVWSDAVALQASAPALPAGGSITVSFTLRTSIGGWTTNLFTVSANEDEILPENNQSTIVTYVGPSGALDIIDPLRLPVKELVYANQSGWAYALERTTATNQTYLFQLDGNTLRPEVLRVLPGVATHLRISSDGHFLYATDKGGRGALRVDLAGSEPDLQFETFNPDPTNAFKFFDMEVDPGDSHVLVAVGRSQIPPGLNYVTTTACFRDGIKLSRTADFNEYTSTPASDHALEIDAGTRIAVLAHQDYGRSVQLLTLAPDGVHVRDGFARDNMAAGFTIINSRLYSRIGEELDLQTGRQLRSLPVSQSGFGLLNWESGNDRVVFSFGGTSGKVQVFDRLTLGRLGVFSLGAVGTLDSSMLLPAGRLALASDTNLVFLTRQSLIGGTAPADLSLMTSFSSQAPKVGESVLITITISNAGPSSATAPAVTLESPIGFTRDSATPSPASSAGNGVFPYPLLWTNTSLAPGQARTFQVQGRFIAAGPMQLAAGVADTAADPELSNNRSEISLPVTYSLSAGQAGSIAFKVVDAVYDGPRNRILATVTGDDPLSGKLVAIAPESGAVLTNWTIGTRPSVMALTDNCQTSYVATDRGTNIAKLDLTSMQVQSVFPVAPDATVTPITAVELRVNPGWPDELVASRTDGQLAYYANGAFQPPPYTYGYDFVFFAPNRLLTPKSSYPFTLNRYAVTGLTLTSDGSGGPMQIQDVRSALGLIFAQDGRVIDPFALTQVGLFGAYGMAAVDPKSELVFYPGYYNSLALRVFDLQTQALLHEEIFSSAWQPVSDLFLAGGNLIAARGAYGALAVMRSATVPTRPPTDLSVAVTAEDRWQVGKLSQWRITVTNSGPYRASDTHILMRLPGGMLFVDASISAVNAVEPQVDLLLGDLPAGRSTAITVRALSQTPSLTAELVVSARSSGSDPNLSNNVSRICQPIESCQVENRLGYFTLNVADLAYDPVGQKLFLSCPDQQFGTNNTLVEIDPAHGTLERRTCLPGSPGCLAVSPGGEFLYVALDAGEKVIRLSLPGLETNLVFSSLPAGGVSCSMVVLPGSPRTLVLSRFGGGTPSPTGVSVYDDGVPRSASVPGGYGGVTFIRQALSTNNLIALDYATGKFRLLNIIPTGLSMQPVAGDPVSISYFDFFVGGTNLLDGNQVFDRATFKLKATLPVSDPSVMALSAAGECAVFAAASNRAQNPIDWAGFRTDTAALIGSTQTPGMPYSLQKCILWGTDGVAAIGNGYFYLGRFDFAGPPFGDSDLDGIPDKWELAHGLDPSVKDALADPDQDGASNFAEYIAGTDPKSSEEALRIVISRFTDNRLRLFFPCGAGHTYWVENSTNLSSGNWTTLTNALSTGGFQTYDAGIATSNATFYRVRLTP